MNDTVDMELPPDVLAERVFNLSPDKFLAVYRLYEQLGRQKAVDEEMHVLRERLRRLRPRRAPNFTRLLCMPFESFIGDGELPGPYLVPRRHCSLLGRYVAALLGPEETTRYRNRIAGIKADDVPSILREGSRFWNQAASAIRNSHIVHRRKRRGSLRDSLELIAGCLEVGAQMTSLTLGLPGERFRELDKKAKALVARTISSVPESRQDCLKYPLVMLSLRLETPPAIIPLLQDKALDLPNALRMTLVRTMSSYLEMDLQAELGLVEEVASTAGNAAPSDLLSELMPSIDKALANRAAGVGSIPVRELLETAGSAVRDHVIVPVPENMAGQLTGLLENRETDPASPLSRIERLEAIERELDNLNQVREHADALGLRLDLTRATASAVTQVKETAKSMMDRLESAVGQTDIEDCRENIYGMVRMIELLEGPDKADVLRLECNRMISGRSAVA